MSVQLNHTIVWCRDQRRSASFLTDILGLPPATRFGHFFVVGTDNFESITLSSDDGGHDVAFVHPPITYTLETDGFTLAN